MYDGAKCNAESELGSLRKRNAELSVLIDAKVPREKPNPGKAAQTKHDAVEQKLIDDIARSAAPIGFDAGGLEYKTSLDEFPADKKWDVCTVGAGISVSPSNRYN